MTDDSLEDVWRRESPHVLGALIRRFGGFDDCEDAVQEALIAAASAWPGDGIPSNPRGWLIRTASRRLIDNRRSERSRTDREHTESRRDVLRPDLAVDATAQDRDDSLALLMLCCHAELSPASQVALTLRAVGGLTTDQIASAFLVPRSTMAQRISRAKATLRDRGATFSTVGADELADRIAPVRQVLYLIFNEGYASSGGDQLLDLSLTREAIRLTRDLRRRLPSDPESAGLLALMLLTEARAPARLDADGGLVPLADQERRNWDRHLTTEGVAILEDVLPHGPVGEFQLQAAIAAVHAEAPRYGDTDWPQIAELYRMLDGVAPGPTVTLNRAVAVGMSTGPAAGLAMIEPLRQHESFRRNHRLHAVRAHLLEMDDRPAEARTAYAEAARLTTSLPEQRYLNAQADRLSPPTERGSSLP